MKTFACIVTAILLASPAQALAYDVITNGGFETGTLAGWQTFNQGSSGGQGSWYPHTSGNGTYSGLPTGAPVGSWQAVADNNGRAAAILYQDIVIPATAKAVLSFRLWYGNAAIGGTYVNGSSLNPASTNQRVRIDLIDLSTPLLTTSSGVFQVLYATTSGSPQAFAPATITQDVTALAGQTVRMRAAVVGTNGGIIAGLDQVRLEVSPFAPGNAVRGMQDGNARWGDPDGDGEYEFSNCGGFPGFPEWQVTWWQPVGSFWFGYTDLPGLTSGGSAWADVDGDGDLDLSGVGTTGTRTHDLVIHRFEGVYYYWTPIAQYGAPGYEPGTRLGSIDWGDWDNDGDLDALVTGTGQSWAGEFASTSIGVNDGSGNLTIVYPGGLPGVTQGNAVFADFTYDGWPDVVQCGTGATAVYVNERNGGFTPMSDPLGTLPVVIDGALAAGDLNNDGLLELVLTGSSGGTPIAKIFTRDWLGFYWVEWTSTGLTGVHQSSVSLGDFDNDGWLDIALCGNNGSAPITRIYHNNGNQTFTAIDAGLPGVMRGSIEFGDWDDDGDLDLVLLGNDGTFASTRPYTNTTPVVNAAPAPPTNLYEGVGQTDIAFAFHFTAYDDLTFWPTYNYRIGSTPGGSDLAPSMSDPVTGRRRLPRPGAAGITWRSLALNRVGHGSVYWSVQSVDQAYRGSPWAPERTLTIGPAITQVKDVPGDQGGALRVTLDRSVLDQASRTTYAAMGYNVWRLVPEGSAVAGHVARDGVAFAPPVAAGRAMSDAGDAAAPRAVGVAPEAGLPLVEWNGRLFSHARSAEAASAFPPGTWEIVGSFFAAQQPSYVVAVPTLADSGAAGTNDQTFIVTVHTTTPSVWFASAPATGHSVDNIAPAAPAGLMAAYQTGSGNQLAWQPAPEPDFHEFRIYRGATPDFTAGPSTLVATAASPAWTDPAYDGAGVHYKVSTRDHAGNESAAVPPVGTTDVDPAAASFVFAFAPASPNPFAATTRLSFTLPEPSVARVEIFDMAGRRVRTLADQRMPAGEHAVFWNGADDAARRVRPGVYFCRLQAGERSAVQRVVRGN